jgi:hypothetical protein
MKLFNFDLITGHFAIGSIVVVSIMASTQAFVNIRPFFDKLLQTAVWELFIAMPILVITYIIGLVFVQLSSHLFDKIRKDTIEQRVYRLILIAQTNSEIIINRYEKLRQESELLQAGSLAILLLSIGLMFKVINATPDIGGTLSYGRLIFLALALLLLFFVPLLQYLATSLYKESIMIVTSLSTKKEASVEWLELS